MNIKLFACYYTTSPVRSSDIVVPLHIGKDAYHTDLKMIADNTGDHISAKNPFFCELTATYWIWKNVKADVVGLFHYRRYLNFANSAEMVHKMSPDFFDRFGITANNIESILKEYDIIVPKPTRSKGKSVFEKYAATHNKSDMERVLDIIKSKYPQQYPMAENALKGTGSIYLANILIARKKVFDEYAAWLFDILFELESQIQADVEQRESYQKRAYGFMGERLMGVFLATHPHLKVKTLPMLMIQTNTQKWLKYVLRQAKRKILTTIGLGKKKWKE